MLKLAGELARSRESDWLCLVTVKYLYVRNTRGACAHLSVDLCLSMLDSTRLGLVWFGLVWFGLVWFGLVLFNLVELQFCLVWFCSVQFGRTVVLFGLVWFGLVWFGLVWFGGWFGLTIYVKFGVLHHGSTAPVGQLQSVPHARLPTRYSSPATHS